MDIDGVYLFTSKWCIPGNKQLEEIKKINSSKFPYVIVDVYKDALMGKKYFISILPTTLIIKNGVVVKAFMGFTDFQVIQSFL